MSRCGSSRTGCFRRFRLRAERVPKPASAYSCGRSVRRLQPVSGRRRNTFPRRCPRALVPGIVLAVACGLIPALADAQVPADAQAPAAPTSPQSQDLEQLRQELASLKREYQARIADLEQRLASLAPAAGVQAAPAPPPGETAAVPPATAPPEAAAPASPVPETAASPPPASAGGVAQGPPESPAPTTQTGQPALSSKVFNPDIAVIGNFLGAAGTNHVEDSPALGAERGRSLVPGSRGSLRARRCLLLGRARRAPRSRKGSSRSPRCRAVCC